MGTLEPTKEVLVGYVQRTFNGKLYIDDYARIDTATGTITVLGDLNPGAGTNGEFYDVAGDLIALAKDNNKAYVIVKPDPGGDAGVTTNYLGEIDPKTGTLKSILGPTQQVNTYGFGYWAGKGYGFSADGRITEINMANGTNTTILTIDAGGGWYGAGVTTDSPTQ